MASFRISTLLAGAVFVAAAGPALADSKLFSVKASTPGITVDQALVDGQALAVSGKGGGVTFFRLDAPGQVPCTQRVTFVASNGASQDADVALCPQDWNFAVQFAAAGSAGPAPAAPATAAAGMMPPGPQALSIATDDPGVGIEAVFIDRKPMTITSRQGNGIEVQVPGGGPCQRDIGLKLSDGRTIARSANLCGNGGSVLVMLGGSSEVAGAPAVPAQPAMPAQPPPPPEQAAAPATASGVWAFTAGDGNAILSFGVPESDDGTFSASCPAASGQANVDILRPVDGLQEGAPVQVTFFAGGFTKTYQAKGSPVSDMDGGSHPAFGVPATDPLWAALAKEAQLVVAVAGQDPFSVSLKGSSAPVKQFLAMCAIPAAAPVAAAPTGKGGGVAYACNDGSALSITWSANMRSAFVSEPGAPPIQLAGGPTGANSGQFANPPASLVGAGESIKWSRFGEPPRTCYPR